MSTPAAPARPHRRAAAQLLLGYLPLLAVGLVLLAVLALRLSAAREPLAAATATTTADVVADGRAPDGRGVAVSFDEDGARRTGTLVLREPVDVPAGAQVAVRYDPDSPPEDTAVYTDGDAAHRAVADLVFGLGVTVAVLLVASAVTGLRVLSRRRLRGAPATDAVGTRVVVRQGLVVRSWLELGTGRGERWVPVHWSPELAALEPDGPVQLRGDLAGRAVLPVVDGAEVWPSGRLRSRPPRGERAVVVPADAPAGPPTWARQVRSDVVVVIAAPVLGLLWAYLDGSGTAGFVFATVLAAAVLFWLAQLLGSDPSPPPRPSRR
ncbi:DUF3592 domain-containing protein [Geodermatophilus sp. SYSU D00691]